jgi:hypothetical protein
LSTVPSRTAGPLLWRNRAKIGVVLVTLLLLLWLAATIQRSLVLLGDPDPVAKAIGLAYLVLPVIGGWALVRELSFGVQTEKMAKILESEGGLPVDDLPRTPAGRIVREAADAQFPRYQAEVEQAPADWRTWFRLSCAYDAAGDRRRARAAMRDAVRRFRSAGQNPGRAPA